MMKRKKSDGSKEMTVTTNAKALGIWASEGDELAQCIITQREAKYQLNNFVKVFETAVDGKGFLHPNYKSIGPITGRIACNKPNLMNVSNTGTKNSYVELRVRECFVPSKDENVLLFADYDQVEVWVSMFLSRDAAGMSDLTSGADMHGNMARKLWGQKYDIMWGDEHTNPTFKKWRKRAKFCLFGLIYGAGSGSIMDTAGCSKEEALNIIDVFWKTFPGLKAFGDELQHQVNSKGFITGPFGREYNIESRDNYKALNYITQGTAAEIMKRALVNLDKEFMDEPDINLLLTIHDEICVETPLKNLKRVKRKSRIAEELGFEDVYLTAPQRILACMQGDFHTVKGLSLPRPFSAGVDVCYNNWAEKTKFKVEEFR
jgi:DNA polymerase-1